MTDKRTLSEIWNEGTTWYKVTHYNPITGELMLDSFRDRWAEDYRVRPSPHPAPLQEEKPAA